MNERIQKLWEQSGGSYDPGNQHVWPSCKILDPQAFAELIVKDVTNILRQEWFNENNDKEETDKRETAIRLGKKLAYMKSVDLITERFGVEE